MREMHKIHSLYMFSNRNYIYHVVLKDAKKKEVTSIFQDKSVKNATA